MATSDRDTQMPLDHAADDFPCLKCGETGHGCFRDPLTGHWYCFKGASGPNVVSDNASEPDAIGTSFDGAGEAGAGSTHQTSDPREPASGQATPGIPTSAGDIARQQPGVCLTKLSEVRRETVRWLWPDRIARGKLTMIAGDPGLGKSFLTIDLASRVSTGVGWPDDPNTTYQPGVVILLNAEDDLADTIGPRLDAAGADSSRIEAITAVRDLDEHGNQSERMADLSRDIRHIEATLERRPDTRLIIIDPVSAYLGNVDSHKNAEVRAVLAHLSELAAKHGVAVVCVTHLRKGEGKAIHQPAGSLAFGAAPRTIWAVTRDENDKSRRLMLPVKNNIGSDRQGLAFTLDGTMRPAPAIRWAPEPVDMTADDAIGESKPGPGPEPSARQAAEQWLRWKLSGGPVPQQEVEEHAQAEGHTKATLRRAKESLRVIAFQPEKPGPWYWKLPDADGPDAQGVAA